MRRHPLGWSRNLPPSRTSAEAKGTSLAFCLLASRSWLGILNSEKFNGHQRDLSTIYVDIKSVDLNTLSARRCNLVKYVKKNNGHVRTRTFVCRACFCQILALMLEACGSLFATTGSQSSFENRQHDIA